MSLSKPRSLKIVSMDDDLLIGVNLDLLSDILKKYKDIPLAVISVAGKMRGGKSYLLSTSLQHCEKINNVSEGFKFQGDTKRCTTGIDVWAKPYKVDGKDLVVLFMDTQGVFDQDQAIAGEANLVALSILLSSVQIFNINRFMDSNDKSYLGVYIQLAKEAQQKNQSGKFQKLLFLIRDFVRTQEIGLDDGAVFLRDRIKPSAELNESFEQIECHLLPHPGNAFEEQREGFARDPQFLDFDAKIRSFVKRVLDPSRLEPKKFNRSPITCGEFVSLLEVLIKWFNSDDATRVKTPQQAMAETRIYGRLKNCKEMYDERMENEEARTDKSKLLTSHEDAMKAVLKKFNGCSASGSETLFEKSEKELLDHCWARLKEFLAQLDKKQEEIDTAAMNAALVIIEEFMTGMNIRSVEVFEGMFQHIKEMAMENYNDRLVVTDAPTGPALKKKLLDELKKRHNDMLPMVKEREEQDKKKEDHEAESQIRDSFQLAKNEYNQVMTRDGQLANKHSEGWKAALNVFNKSPKEPQEIYKKYRNDLEEYIQAQFVQLQRQEEETNARKEEEWQREKARYMEIVGEVLKVGTQALPLLLMKRL